MVALSKLGLIVLAAGLSRRMGGPNKLLQSYRGAPLLAHALRIGEEIGFADRLAVTGRDSTEIEDLAAFYRFRCIHNARFAEGLGTSIAAGASALNQGVGGVFIALGDMPDIGARDYRLLSRNLRQGAIVVPVYGTSRGHPVLFCASYLTDLSALAGDEGARSILKRHAAHVAEVETTNPGILRDLDTPDDFQEPRR